MYGLFHQVMGPGPHVQAHSFIYIPILFPLITLITLISVVPLSTAVITTLLYSLALPSRVISLLIVFTLITTTHATSTPKVSTILEGVDNYKRWSTQVQSALILLGTWWTIIKPKPVLTTSGTGTTATVRTRADARYEADRAGATVHVTHLPAHGQTHAHQDYTSHAPALKSTVQYV